MDRITVGSPVDLQFGGLAEPVVVVDRSGRTLGHFVPTGAMAAADDCPYSPEELERMRLEEGGRSLQEIWKSLGAK